MKRILKKYIKKRKQQKKYAGFTILEILLVIAILAVIFIMVIYRIRPVEVFRRALHIERTSDAKAIENAIQDYLIQNNGVLPAGFENVQSGTFDICTAGQTNCSGNSVNIDSLVNSGFLPEVPVSSDNTNPGTTGYTLTYDPITNTYTVGNYQTQQSLSYKRIIEIFNNSFSQNDYQLRLVLNTQDLVALGKVNTDCSNINFTNSEETKLDYWIEPNTCNTPTTKIWFKSPQIPNGTSTINLYYGLAGLTNNATDDPAEIFDTTINNLSGFWDFSISESYPGSGNTLYDLSGRDGHFYHSGSPEYDPLMGFHFDDNGHFTGPSAALFPQESDPRTVVAIANPDQNISPYGHVFHYGTPAKYRSFGIAINNNAVSSHTWSSECASGVWTMDADNMIAITSSGSMQQIYKNGVLIGTCNSYTLDTGSSNPLQIGVRIGQSEPWIGYIKYVQFYDRVLTAGEIQGIYNSKSYATVNYPGTTLTHKYSAEVSITNIYDEVEV